ERIRVMILYNCQ
ncbi:protein of unknown function DUF820, partial [Gloeomargarita lithophora Alchichica-D10]